MSLSEENMHRHPLAETGGAYAILCDFQQHFGNDLQHARQYLAAMVENPSNPYAEAYRNWLSTLTEFMRGMHLLSKKIPLPNSKTFRDALNAFQLESSIMFVHDLCIAAGHKLAQRWAEEFRKQVIEVMAAFQVIVRQQQQTRGMSRG